MRQLCSFDRLKHEKIKVTPANPTISGLMIDRRDRIQIKLKINPVTFCSFKTFAMANDTDGGWPNSLSSINVHQPDVLFIDYALNDRSAGLAKAKDAWEKMIRAAREKNIKVILLTSSPDQRVDILKEGNDLEVHSEQMRRMALANEVGLVDFFSLFREIAQREGPIIKYMSHVNHPNAEGHEVIANAIMKWF